MRAHVSRYKSAEGQWPSSQVLKMHGCRLHKDGLMQPSCCPAVPLASQKNTGHAYKAVTQISSGLSTVSSAGDVGPFVYVWDRILFVGEAQQVAGRWAESLLPAERANDGSAHVQRGPCMHVSVFFLWVPLTFLCPALPMPLPVRGEGQGGGRFADERSCRGQSCADVQLGDCARAIHNAAQ